MKSRRARGPAAGAFCFVRGLRLLAHPRLRGVVALPLAINTALFAAAIAYAASDFRAWIDRLVPAWLEWLRWLLWPLFAAVALLVLFYGFSLMANVVAAPFNAVLAARVERLLDPGPHGGAAGGAVREALRGLIAELRKLGYFAVRAAALLVLTLIPGVNVAAPFLWAAFGAWALALEYLDYPMGNHGIGFPEQRRRLRARLGTTLGFGGAALLATMIPVVNFLAMPAAVAGATVLWTEAFAPEPGGTRDLSAAGVSEP